MTIKVTYNVTDVYMSQSVSPVYINVSYSDGGASGGGVWGSITGTLSNQTDLQNALNAKFDDPTGTTTQYIDGTGGLQTFPLTLPVLQEVRNQTGATLDAGTVVYINGATGNKPTVTKAIATGDATSAQTLGMISAAIANNGVGYVVVIGTCGGLDTSAYTEGQQLYLSGTVAGGVTTTKPYAPIHLVYVGIVTRSHPTLGTIEVRVQNGIEVDEIHNVSAQTPSNNDGLFYNTTTSLWESKSITTALGYTPVPTTRNITINGVTYDLSADRTFSVGTISGSGASGQVTYWTGASAVSGSNNLFWDNANGRLGIGTNAPSTTLQIIGTTTLQRFTATTGNNYIDFNSGILYHYGVSNSYYQYPSTVNYHLFSRTASGSLVLGAGDIERMRLFGSTGNVSIGTASDLAVRLGVVGDTLLRGSGNTSATNALTVQNSSFDALFRVRNDGAVLYGIGAYIAPMAAGTGGINPAGQGLRFEQNDGSSIGRSFLFIGTSITSTSGTRNNIQVLQTFAPTSGTAVFNNLTLEQTINQTGGANGITRGLYVNPTLTSAADFRAIETTNGKIVFGNLPTSSAGLPTGALWNDAGTVKIV